jgi:hypothetical protein
MKFTSFALFGSFAVAEKSSDLVTNLPDFPDASTWGFKAYSGLLDVPGPVNGYDSLRIHYQFHTSQKDPQNDPVTIWHQGGPGGSSITVGLYGEMGAFQIGDEAHGNYLNPSAWNKVSNMLYLESPAGSGGSRGYSECIKNGKVVDCKWDDKTQAEAYAHTLQAFFNAFPEFASNDFYLSGESYFGQYGPNIAHYILNNEPFASSINLKGIAAGNACWGGTETCLACNGPSQDNMDVDLFFGKGLFSPKLKAKIDEACNFPTDYIVPSGGGGSGPFDCDGSHTVSSECKSLLKDMRSQVGPHDVYDIYNNCPRTQAFLQRVGQDAHWLRNILQSNMHNASATRDALKEMNGGYDWDCGGSVGSWITSTEVRQALHLGQAGASDFDYTCSGPASITLWPELARKLRVLIYNGDADACVPYIGNEDWISSLEDQGILKETSAWKPWYHSNRVTPAGYTTSYVAKNSEFDFTFRTIRLAGHMAPTFQPEASLQMLSDFFGGAKQTVI